MKVVTYAGINVVEVDDPGPIRDQAENISRYSCGISTSTQSAHDKWQGMRESYVDPAVSTELYGAYDRPRDMASHVATGGSSASVALETLADSYQNLRTKRKTLVQELEQLALDEGKEGAEKQREKLEARRSSLSQKATSFNQEKEQADALCVVALGGIPSPHGQPRSQGKEAGFYEGIFNVAAKAAERLAKSAGESWLDFKPPYEGGTANDWARYGIDKSFWAASTTLMLVQDIRYRRFRPQTFVKGFGWSKETQYTNGKSVYGRNYSPWQLFKLGLGKYDKGKGISLWKKYKSWDPKFHFDDKYGTEKINSRFDKAGKFLGRAGFWASGLLASWEEWDKGDASKSLGNRAARSAVVGGTTMVGAAVGAKAGATLGAAIGTAVFPGVGTAVGAVAGGLIGGFVGAEGGKWVGDGLKGFAGDVADIAGNIGENVGSSIGNLGKSLKFW